MNAETLLRATIDTVGEFRDLRRPERRRVVGVPRHVHRKCCLNDAFGTRCIGIEEAEVIGAGRGVAHALTVGGFLGGRKPLPIVVLPGRGPLMSLPCRVD
jgi:hypothetical protein